VNLVKEKEKKERESILAQEFESSVEFLNYDLPDDF
jgi:hypothetical protein